MLLVSKKAGDQYRLQQVRGNMSLYAKYIAERGGKFIVEEEHGFATFSYLQDGIYIEDIYIEKDYRKLGNASSMADKIALIAKDQDYKYLYGTVCPEAKGSTESMKVLLAYGFQLHGSIQNLVWFRKEI